VRRLIFAVAVAILVWAAVIVPLPLLAVEPVPARPVDDIVTVADTADDVPGSLRFTAVRIRPQSTVGSVRVWLDDDRSLTFTPAVVPRGVEPEEFVELQTRLFEESIRVAAAVGLRAAGAEVTIAGDGARVVRTVPGSSAADTLERGDVIVAVNGADVALASEVAAVVSRQEVGDRIEVTVRRDGERVTEQVTVGQLPQDAGPGIGVLAGTVDLRIDTPVDVSPREGVQVGGPSAGLMIALGVYDATSDTDLTQGRVIAGTGTIDTSGNVGPVSGIAEKVAGAELADADVFLVPAEQAPEARAAAPPGLEVVAVASLADAITAIEG
jgi:PDZ domain-containing protein